MSRRRRGRRSALPAPVLALAIVAIAFFALPLIGLLWRAPWSSAWSVSDRGRCADGAATVAGLLAVGHRSVDRVRGAARLAAGTGRVPWARRGAGACARCRWCSRRSSAASRCSSHWVVAASSVSTSTSGSTSRLPFTTAGVVVAQTFVAMPFLVITVEASLRQMDTRFEDASRTLGASRWYTFRRVTIPAIGPALGAGAVLAWARALGEFGATITFAGNFPGTTQTMPLAVYLSLETNPEEAIVLVLAADRDLLQPCSSGCAIAGSDGSTRPTGAFAA